ncbi:MAG: YqjD family protein [Limisphaerales bacterium]
MNTRYETPEALRHDADTLADDARALLTATADVADAKVASARLRLESALHRAHQVMDQAKCKAMDSTRAADTLVRSHPYESLAVAFGVGTLLGCLMGRRH